MNDKNSYPGRQWRDRFSMWAKEFPRHYWQRREKVQLTGFFTKDRLTFLQAAECACREAQPVPVGTVWGKWWEYGWFFADITVPDELAGRHLIFLPGMGKEMLIWINGAESGSVDRHHGFVTLSRQAVAGEHFQIVAECYAGHGPRMEDGGFCPGGEAPFSEADSAQLVTQPSWLAVWQEEMFQAGMDYLTLYSLLSRLPASSLRAMKVTEGLKRFTTDTDFELSGEELTENFKQADAELKSLLACRNGSTAPEFVAFGQSHLDLAWLWTAEETRRKAARTYSNQLALMEEYPAYKFLLCEPPILEYLEESYPVLWQRVKQKVKEGQIIAEGAVYVECDTNMPCSESLVRQFLYGKEWFLERLSVESRLAWMPDTFGFSAALPQIMKQCKVPWFATQKLIRQDPECEPFPYNDFWWQGIDGSRVLAHTYKENNAAISPADMISRWEDDRIQQEGMEGMLYPFGYGDGGGGANRELLETAARCADLEGAPKIRQEGPAAYFEALEKRGTENIFVGELYLAWHRGTYTAQARTKRGVRRAECLLRETEYRNTLLAVLEKTASGRASAGSEPGIQSGAGDRAEALKRLWKRLLLQEFHDVLPGTGIAQVHKEAEEELARIAGECEALLREILTVLEGRPEFSEAPLAGGMAAEDRMRPVQTVQTGVCREEGRYFIKSEHLYAELDRTGRVHKLCSLKTGKACEAAGRPMNTLRLYRNVNSYYDAWEIGSMYESEEEPSGQDSFSLRQAQYDGRPAWLLEGTVGKSPFSQFICLSEDGGMLEFHTRMDWRERHRMLKVDFPCRIRASEVAGEIAFGICRRPVNRSWQWEKDRYEVCSHRYSVLENGREGMALLNDCKYGSSAKEDQISLTLLRAPLKPDMHADQGIQEFSYACLPFDGMLRDAGVVQRAAAFNRHSHINASLRQRMERLGGRGSLLEVAAEETGGGCHVVLEAAKLAEDKSGRAVLRLYEAAGSPQRVRITFSFPVQRVEETDLLEREGKPLMTENNGIVLDFNAFEIKTLLLP